MNLFDMRACPVPTRPIDLVAARSRASHGGSVRLRRLCSGLLTALLGVTASGRAADEFLDPAEAFKASVAVRAANSIEVGFDVAPGYYLYRNKFRFTADAGTVLGSPVVPAGTLKFDETFQKEVETHRGRLRIAVPVQRAPASFKLVVTAQGCADKGLCYPPTTRGYEVRLTGFGGDGQVRALGDAEMPAEAPTSVEPNLSTPPVTPTLRGPAPSTRGGSTSTPTAASRAGK